MGALISKSVDLPSPEEEAVDDGSNNQPDKSILVLGAGNFGTCLANHLAHLENNVTIYARDQKVVDGINNAHRNVKYMPGVELSENLSASSCLDSQLFDKNTAIICAIPTKQMRSVLKQIKSFIKASHLLIFVNKGIEADTLMLPNEVVIEELGPEIGKNASFLSGPSFAIEVVNHEYTCVTVASEVYVRALRAQNLFHAPFFRVYVSTDVVGVELAGALKNVMALASGASSGMGLQMNARTALVTRALAEITRIGARMGANPLTFAGLSGVGDLFLTCSSEKSRNFTVGFRIAKGESVDQILENLGSVAEGVATTPAAYALCRRLDVDSPIIDAVYAVVCQGQDLKQVFDAVTHRKAKPEIHR